MSGLEKPGTFCNNSAAIPPSIDKLASAIAITGIPAVAEATVCSGILLRKNPHHITGDRIFNRHAPLCAQGPVTHVGNRRVPEEFYDHQTGDLKMATYLYIATAIGLFIATQTRGDWEIVRHTLKEKDLTSIAVSEGLIIAGTTDGLWRSSDNGKSWNESNGGLSIRHIRWIVSSSYTPMTFLVGTEPAGIFVSTDGGKTWGNRPEIGKLRDANGWFLPYSPEAGCVRGFAVSKPDNHCGRMYAAVEVGGALISEDSGETWKLVEGSDGNPDFNRELGTMIHPDVHSITVHPSFSDLVTAATGGGLYRSTDGGREWKNLYPCYIRAIWVDPTDPQHMIAGPADGVSRNGRIEESYDGGQNWHLASDGMPSTPWSRHMVERFVQLDNVLFALLSNGELWDKQSDDSSWHRVLSEVQQIRAVAAVR